MTWQVEWSKEAGKALKKLGNPKEQLRIIEAVRRFTETGHGDVKALHGADAGQYRLRVGTYRVRFEKDGQRLVILVLDVAPRREAYR